MNKLFPVVITTICAFMFFHSIASAKTIIDQSFSIPSVANWQTVRNMQWNNPLKPCMNQSVPAQWQVINQALSIIISGPACIMELTDASLEIPTNTDQYSIAFDMRTNSTISADRNFAYRYVDSQNWSNVKMVHNYVYFENMVNGIGRTDMNNVLTYDFKPDVWYHFRLKVGEFVELYINDQYVGKTPNHFFHSTLPNKIAFQASVGALYFSSVSFDNLKVDITELGDIKPTPSPDVVLNVPQLKQHQEPWVNLEYDSASKWSNDGISFADWGCALTSAVMIMQYHGLTTMPDGTSVSPLTVNNWLLANHGYANGGYVSFASLAALTKQISNTYGTSALEYKRIQIPNSINESERKNSYQKIVQNNIDDNMPLIAQIPGHFVVANGYTGETNDTRIIDPAYNRSLLSQHQSALVSLRSFTPSHTDVSFLEIVSPAETSLSLIKGDGLEIVDAIQSIEEISKAGNPQTISPSLRVIELAKPPSGTYILKAKSGSGYSSASIKHLSSEGIATVEEIPILGSTEIPIQLVENSIGKITPVYTYDRQYLVGLLSMLKDKGLLTSNGFDRLLETMLPANRKPIMNALGMLQSEIQHVSKSNELQLIGKNLLEQAIRSVRGNSSNKK